jgi:hypothetical protein
MAQFPLTHHQFTANLINQQPNHLNLWAMRDHPLAAESFLSPSGGLSTGSRILRAKFE